MWSRVLSCAARTTRTKQQIPMRVKPALPRDVVKSESWAFAGRALHAMEENSRGRRSTEFAVPSAPVRRGAAQPLRPMTPEQSVAVDSATKTWPDLMVSTQADALRAPLYRQESRRRLELVALSL